MDTETLQRDHTHLRERIHRLLYRCSVAEDRADRLRTAIEGSLRTVDADAADRILRDAIQADNAERAGRADK